MSSTLSELDAPSQRATKGPLVVVGGGAAGLELVTRWSRRSGPAGDLHRSAVLVDVALGHVWKPRLHEIATAMQSQAAAESSYLGHANAHGYRFELGALQDVDLAAKEIVLAELAQADGAVVLPSRRIAYSKLVLALGSEENDFGTPGARAHCLFLNTPQQAAAIRDALLVAAFRLARHQQDEMSVVIIGGGATGVELAAEIRHALDELWRHEPDLDRARVRITIVEAGDRLLSANPEPLSAYATRALKRLGVRIALGERVAGVDAEGVQLASGGRIASELKIWTAGIRGPRVFDTMPQLPRTRSGRVKVDEMLQCEGVPDVYAVGDCAEWTDPTNGHPAPYTAQVASAQAQYLAHALAAGAAGQAPAPFRFESAGAVVSLGQRGATGNLTTRFGRQSRDHFIQGFSARWVYGLLYRRHELAIHGWRGASARWLVEWLSGAYEPTLKLH